MGKAFRTSFLLFCFPPYDISSQALVTTSSVKKQPTKPKKPPKPRFIATFVCKLPEFIQVWGKKIALLWG